MILEFARITNVESQHAKNHIRFVPGTVFESILVIHCVHTVIMQSVIQSINPLKQNEIQLVPRDEMKTVLVKVISQLQKALTYKHSITILLYGFDVCFDL